MGPKQWYCRINGEVLGPISGQELAQLAESGQLRRSDEIRKNADGEWAPAANVLGLRFGTAIATGRPNSIESPVRKESRSESESCSHRASGYSHLLSGLSGVSKELGTFWLVLGISIVVACWTILANPPTESGWWIFKTVSYPHQMLLAAAFLIASGYLFLLSKWYSRSPGFRCGPSIQAFLLCGGISVLLCYFVYPAWAFVCTTTVSGWFIDSVEYRNSIFGFIDKTGIIAGPVEEAAKLLAVISVAPVRKLIQDRRSGLFYVTLCAFGFAMIENIGYFRAFNGILIIRANPAHAVFSSVWELRTVAGLLARYLASTSPNGCYLEWLCTHFGIG